MGHVVSLILVFISLGSLSHVVLRGGNVALSILVVKGHNGDIPLLSLRRQAGLHGLVGHLMGGGVPMSHVDFKKF